MLNKIVSRILIVLTLLVTLGLLIACSPNISASNTSKAAMDFEIVSQDAPPDGGGRDLVTFAVLGSQTDLDIPKELPQAAVEALTNAIAAQKSALYIVVYLGERSSTGFQVNIEVVEVENEKLQVTYSIQKPDPEAGGAPAQTYPYVIVRVLDGDIPAGGVVFVER